MSTATLRRRNLVPISTIPAMPTRTVESAAYDIATAFQCVAGALLSPSIRRSRIVALLRRVPPPRGPLDVVITKLCCYELLHRVTLLPGEWHLSASAAVAVAIEVSKSSDPVDVLRRSLVQDGSAEQSHAARRMEQYLAEHYAERLTLQAASDALGISRASAQKIAVRSWGCTVAEKLRQVRVHRGLSMVKDGTKVEAASLLVGYRSKKDFYHAIKKELGITPAAVRHCAEAGRWMA